MLDGELIAFNDACAPHWPLVVERVLHGNTAISLTFVAFDLLRVDGHDVTGNPWSQRRTLLEGVWAERPCARLADLFDDGHVLFDAVVEHGLEGIVAKRRTGLYRSGYPGMDEDQAPELLAAGVRDRADAATTRGYSPRLSGPRRRFQSRAGVLRRRLRDLSDEFRECV